jgi:DNA-binding NarL/FixJ family response regulator
MTKTVTLVSSRKHKGHDNIFLLAETLNFRHDKISDFGEFFSILNDPESCPDLALFDMQSLQVSGLSSVEIINMISTAAICSKGGKIPTLAIMIDETCEKHSIAEIQNTNIKGYVLDDFEEARRAIIDLLAGRTSMPKDILSFYKKKPEKVVDVNVEIKLTARQKQVMKLVCNRGLSNKAIAQVLKISESTVKIHVSAILKAYGVRNRTQLALAVSDSLKAE